MTTAKKTSATKSADIKSSVHDAAETASENLETIAQTAINRAKEAIPSLDDVTAAASDASAYLQDNANLDLQGMADDATQFVRRNPGTSLAAAAGLGILIGILATKRS